MAKRYKSLKYIKSYVDCRGHARYYFRRKGFKETALPGMPGSAEFMQVYTALLGAPKPEIGKDKLIPKSIGHLTTIWMDTDKFKSLKEVSKKPLRRLIAWLQENHGHRSVVEMRRRHVAQLLECWADKPSDHNRLLSLLRRMLAHAVRLEWILTTPVVEFEKKKLRGAYATWTEEEVSQFETMWGIGTKERTAFDLLLWTAQRSADVRGMGRQLITSGRLALRQSKTGNPVDIPMPPALSRSLSTVPAEQLLFLLDSNGKKYTESTFQHFFSAAIKAAGLIGRTPHGLRKTACVRLADAGCSALQIQAISGHKSLRECEKYVQEANRRRLAVEAMARIAHLGGDQIENRSV